MDPTARRQPAIPVVLLLGAALGLLAGMVCAVAVPQASRATAVVMVAARNASFGDPQRSTRFAQSAADSYAGLVDAPVVLEGAARRLGAPVTAADLAAHVSVGRPSGTALLAVHASDTSASAAAQQANAVAAQLLAESRSLSPSIGAPRSEVVVVEPASAAKASTGPGTLLMVLSGMLAGVAVAALVLVALRVRPSARARPAS